MVARQPLSDTLGELERLLGKLPGPLRQQVLDSVRELRTLMLDQRPPRFALVGRRGSGKSSLINAVFGRPVVEVGHERATTGAAHWERHEGDLGVLEILDTRGLQEGSRPEQADTAATAVDSILDALRRQPPDAILFLVKATEADAAIDGDLDALETITARIASFHGARTPIVGVLTQCDTVEPKTVRLDHPDGEDPDDLAEKLDRVGRLERQVEARLRARPTLKDDLVRVIGVSSYQSWRRDGSLRADERWRIDALLAYLLEELPDEARVELVRVSRVVALQRTLARRIVHACTVVSGGIALTPLPVADLVPLTALQVSMVTMVGYVSGRKVDARAVGEFLGGLGLNVGAAVGLREVARQLLKLLPGPGTAASAAIAAAGTKAIGEAAILYFVDGASLLRAREGYEAAKRRPTEADEEGVDAPAR